MIARSKLRGPIGKIAPFAVAVFLCLGSVEAILTQKFIYSAFGFGCFFIVLGIIEYRRTKLWTYLILGLFFGTATWHSMARFIASFLSLETYIPHVLISILVLIVSLPVVLEKERLESNARRLFNLAAESVQESSDGFTPRPYSRSAAEYTKDEICGFARFMTGNNIAKSFIREEAVTLSFSMSISPLKETDLRRISYVSFDLKGNISVFIAKPDYKQFKEELAFDHLCASLSDVFLRFLKYYRQGQENRILVELMSVGK